MNAAVAAFLRKRFQAKFVVQALPLLPDGAEKIRHITGIYEMNAHVFFTPFLLSRMQ
jgi:hypothetical protein